MRTFVFNSLLSFIFSFLSIAFISTSNADQLVEIGGDRTILNKPAGKPRGSVILLPGGRGMLRVNARGKIRKLKNNQLIRTRKAYARAGLASLAVSRSVDLPAAIRYMRKIAKPVVVVGTSRATTWAHRALPARPKGLVLTSAMLDIFQSNVGSASRLPKTLIVHHRSDECRVTLPSLVKPFKKWGGSRVKVKWITGGCDRGNPCKAKSHHGFNCQDSKIVRIVSSFVRSLR